MSVFLESWEQCEKTADIPKSSEQYKQEIMSDFLTETSWEIQQFCRCFFHLVESRLMLLVFVIKNSPVIKWDSRLLKVPHQLKSTWISTRKSFLLIH